MKRIALFLLAVVTAFGGNRSYQFGSANAETSAGTHQALTRRADASHPLTHLLVKAGSDDQHATFCGASNVPIGTTTDAPEAAEDLFNVHPLQIAKSTRLVRVATAIANDTDLYTAANGLAQGLPAAAGTYYHIGRSVAAAVLETTGNYLIEFAPRAPGATVVLGAAGYPTAGLGAGGTVVQITSSATGVTVNALSGQITTVALTTAAGVEERFTVTNSQVTAKDCIALGTTYNGAGTPALSVANVAAGSFDLVITNLHGSVALNAALTANFAIVRAQTT